MSLFCRCIRGRRRRRARSVTIGEAGAWCGKRGAHRAWPAGDRLERHAVVHRRSAQCRHGCERLLRPRRKRRSEEHTSELQSRGHIVCRLLLEKRNSYAGNIVKSEKNTCVHSQERDRVSVKESEAPCIVTWMLERRTWL